MLNVDDVIMTKSMPFGVVIHGLRVGSQKKVMVKIKKVKAFLHVL